MNVYVLLISRLTPILVWLTFCLVAGRYLHDRLQAGGRAQAARLVFAAFLVLGGATSLLSMTRTALLASAGVSDRRHDWAGVDLAFRRYVATGSRVNPAIALHWAAALMHERRFKEAEAVLFRAAQRRSGKVVLSRDVVLMIGQCMYYQHRYSAAEGALRVASGTTNGYLRDYFLGRVVEQRGDKAAAAALYEQALRVAPEFFPAFFSRVRLLLLSGDRKSAARRLAAFRSEHATAAQNALFPSLVAAAAGGPVPAPVEFYIEVD